MKNFAKLAILALAALAASAHAQTQTWGSFSIGGRDGRVSGGFSSYERGGYTPYGYGAPYGGSPYGYRQQPPAVVVPVPVVPRYDAYVPGYVYGNPHYREQRYCLEDYRQRCYMDRRHGSKYACDVPPVAIRQACMR